MFSLPFCEMTYLGVHRLKCEFEKTKYMIFARQNSVIEREIKIANIPIERKTEARFLGVIIDVKLTWSKHIETIKSKMSRYLGIMHKIRNHLPLKARLQIYHSFIQSHLNFCSLVWGFAAKTYIDSVFSKQKAGIRAVMDGYINFKYRKGEIPTHTKPFFTKNQILTVPSIIAKKFTDIYAQN